MLLTSEFQRLGIAIDATRDGEVSDEDREHGIVGRQSLLKEVAALRKILEDRGSAKTLLLGGDCATDLAPIAYHLTPDLTIVYFYAHADLNQPSESPSGALHGMVLRHLLGHGDAELVSILGRSLNPE